MRLFYILKRLGLNNKTLKNHKVTNIVSNSKEVTKGSIFIAIKGDKNDGNKYIEEAISNGAKTIFTEQEIKNKKVNIITVRSIKKTQALIAKYYYKEIFKDFNITAITGTNGKTTITNILHNYLEYEGIEVMSFGTLGVKFRNNTIKTNNTTIDILEIYKYFKIAKENKISTIVMEVSSHAIKELRIFGITFSNIIYSNITRDHLDYHKTIDDYLYTKARLINSLRKGGNLILNEDEKYYTLFKNLTVENVISYSTKEKSDNTIKIIDENPLKTRFLINDKVFETKILGDFNIYNIASIISLIKEQNFNLNNFNKFLQFFNFIEGRMNIVYSKQRMIIIDYAHTPDAVEGVLKSLKRYKPSRLTVVVGCGGNRDKDKRHIMGEISFKYSDKVIFTNDNPRNEEPKSIIRDMTRTIETPNYKVILDRKKAIRTALKESIEDEVIAILGKGHEEYQEIKDELIKCNDKKTVEEILKEGD